MFSLRLLKQFRPIIVLILLSAACASTQAGSQLTSSLTPFAPNLRFTSVLTATSPEIPTQTAIPLPTSEPPAGFTSEILREGIVPVNYISDVCSYYQMRWDPNNSTPGTVVAPIMFHSIRPGNETSSDPSAINANTFAAIVKLAKDLGFETITSDELFRFLAENAKIPPRSMILILDDRRPGTAEDYFLPINQENHWTTTLAWPIGDTDQRKGNLAGETMWDWVERLNETGYFDFQSHGLNHIPITDRLSEEAVHQEIEGSIPILKKHFGQRPIAFIWPGGNYTALGIKIASEAGFKLGFTIYPRGPILFNWIPQDEAEREIGTSFLLLPRFWDTAALLNLQQTAELGDAAREFARQNYAGEANWYLQNCGGELPPLNKVLKQKTRLQAGLLFQ